MSQDAEGRYAVYLTRQDQITFIGRYETFTAARQVAQALTAERGVGAEVYDEQTNERFSYGALRSSRRSGEKEESSVE